MTEVAIVATQVLYGWMEIKGKSGFQLISMSSSLNQRDHEFLEKYSIPLNTDNLRVTECRRFFQLPSGKIAVNFIKNIGKDTHGREGALYSHFLIFEKNVFYQTQKNIMMIDSHHLKGISSIKDLEKLKLPDGNMIKLPEETFEVKMEDESYMEDFISSANGKYVSDVIYSLFLNLFQPDMKINVVGKNQDSIFESITTLEKLLPSWVILSYSTYVYPTEESEPFLALKCRDSKSLHSGEIIIDFGSMSVALPGEDKFIRTIATYYERMIRSGEIFKISAKFMDDISRDPIDFLIGEVIMNICKGEDLDLALDTALMVSELNSYGKSEQYYKMISDIIVNSNFKADLVKKLISYLVDKNDKIFSEGGQGLFFMETLVRADPKSEAGKMITEYIEGLIKQKGNTITDKLVSVLMTKQSEISMAKSLMSAIPYAYKSYVKFINDNNLTYEILEKSTNILGEFENTRQNLFKLFESYILAHNDTDQDHIIMALNLLYSNRDIFDEKKIKILLASLEKALGKRKVLIAPDLRRTMERFTTDLENHSDEKKRFHFR